MVREEKAHLLLPPSVFFSTSYFWEEEGNNKFDDGSWGGGISTLRETERKLSHPPGAPVPEA